MYTTAQILSMPVDELEQLLRVANVEYTRGNDNFLLDSDYNRGIERLEEEKPSSELLQEISSVDEYSELDYYDTLLNVFPMRSVDAVSSQDKMGPYQAYRNRVSRNTRQLASLKADGFSIRCVYVRGKLTRAYTRGRKTKGKDITKVAMLLVPVYVEAFSMFNLLETRHELVLPHEGFEILKKRHPDETFVNARNSVAHMIADGVSDEDIKLLKAVLFNIVVLPDDKDKAEWLQYRSTKIDFAKTLGFDTIPHTVFYLTDSEEFGVTEDDLIYSIIDQFGEAVKERCGYKSDGVVFNVDSEEEFEALGWQGKFNNGAVAMKIRDWDADDYTALIKRIYFSYGAKNISIMAEIEPVTMANGNTVTSLELKSITIMQMIGAYEGATVRFRYSSEMIPDLIYPGHGM